MVVRSSTISTELIVFFSRASVVKIAFPDHPITAIT
jgi:hypothetical protein